MMSSVPGVSVGSPKQNAYIIISLPLASSCVPMVVGTPCLACALCSDSVVTMTGR